MLNSKQKRRGLNRNKITTYLVCRDLIAIQASTHHYYHEVERFRTSWDPDCFQSTVQTIEEESQRSQIRW